MVTQKELVDYSLSLVGKKVTVPSNLYGGQCVSLIDHIVQKFTNTNVSYTNAVDLLSMAKKRGFAVTYDAPGRKPKAGDIYVIQTFNNIQGHAFGHVGIAVKDSDGKSIEGVEQNVDGYSDNNKNGINDQLEVGGGGYTRRVSRDWYAGSTLYNKGTKVQIGKVLGWFTLPYTTTSKGASVGTKNVNGDIFSNLITAVDPNLMNADRNRVKIDRIVLHHNAGTSDAGARRTWYKSTGIGTSAHYQVAGRTLWGCVGENFVAYHAGNYPMNQRSIGIEHLNSTGAPNWLVSEDTIKTSIKLVADICKRYGIPCDRKHILKHSEVSPTACPGGLPVDRIVREAKALIDGKPVQVKTATPVAKPAVIKTSKKVYRADEIKHVAGLYQIRCNELAPTAFTWLENGIPVSMVNWYNADGTNRTDGQDKDFKAGMYFTFEGDEAHITDTGIGGYNYGYYWRKFTFGKFGAVWLSAWNKNHLVNGKK